MDKKPTLKKRNFNKRQLIKEHIARIEFLYDKWKSIKSQQYRKKYRSELEALLATVYALNPVIYETKNLHQFMPTNGRPRVHHKGATKTVTTEIPVDVYNTLQGLLLTHRDKYSSLAHLTRRLLKAASVLGQENLSELDDFLDVVPDDRKAKPYDFVSELPDED